MKSQASRDCVNGEKTLDGTKTKYINFDESGTQCLNACMRYSQRILGRQNDYAQR